MLYSEEAFFGNKEEETMKRKYLTSVLAATLVTTMAFTACGGNSNSGANNDASNDNAKVDSDEGYRIALITDVGTIDDKSFNQGSWEGVEKYGEEAGITYKYYKPVEKTTIAYEDTMKLAIEGGAEVVVCPGYLFEQAVYELQVEYPDTKFILIDGEPNDGATTPTYETKENTLPILFQEDQAGFLAGYAAVYEGYTSIGFMGGMAVPAVMRYGYGYVQGAEYACEELGIDSVEVKYNYTGTFNASPEVASAAAAWYQSGTEVIFGCGGGIGNSIMSAAEDAGTVMIGVDVDQSSESDSVVTSAMKLLSNAVYDGVKSYFDGNFTGGETVTYDASVDGVGLPMESSKFEKFDQDAYDSIYAKVKSGEVEIDSDVSKQISELSLTHVNVTVVE